MNRTAIRAAREAAVANLEAVDAATVRIWWINNALRVTFKYDPATDRVELRLKLAGNGLVENIPAGAIDIVPATIETVETLSTAVLKSLITVCNIVENWRRGTREDLPNSIDRQTYIDRGRPVSNDEAYLLLCAALDVAPIVV